MAYDRVLGYPLIVYPANPLFSVLLKEIYRPVEKLKDQNADETETAKRRQMDDLLEKNRELKAQIDIQRSNFEQLEQNVEILKEENAKVKEMESRIAELRQESEQSSLERELLEELKLKNELLQKQHEESRNRQIELQTAINRLESERNDLLKAKQAGVDRSELEALSNRLAGSIETIETLKGENRNLLQANQDLASDYKKIEAFNLHLREKEKMMQYELVKNRAQALGLEKICEDFKVQIETMASTAK